MIYLCTHSDTLTEQEKELLLSVLSPERKEKLSKKKKDYDAALISYAILALECNDNNLSFGEHGKPYFSNRPNIHFSISHTPGAAVVGISEKPIGADIESVNRTVPPDVLRRICTEKEFLQYQDTSSEEKITLWTLKESYGKYTGKGISLPLTDISFSSITPPVCSDPSVYLTTLVQDGFVCSAVSEAEEKIESISLKTILEKIQEKC